MFSFWEKTHFGCWNNNKNKNQNHFGKIINLNHCCLRNGVHSTHLGSKKNANDPNLCTRYFYRLLGPSSSSTKWGGISYQPEPFCRLEKKNQTSCNGIVDIQPSTRRGGSQGVSIISKKANWLLLICSSYFLGKRQEKFVLPLRNFCAPCFCSCKAWLGR